MAYVFLALNGYDLDAIEPDVVTTMEGVAASPVSEAVRTTWVRARLYRLSKWRYVRIDEGPSPADQSMGGSVNGVGTAQAAPFDSSHRPFTAEHDAVTADSLSEAIGRR